MQYSKYNFWCVGVASQLCHPTAVEATACSQTQHSEVAVRRRYALERVVIKGVCVHMKYRLSIYVWHTQGDRPWIKQSNTTHTHTCAHAYARMNAHTADIHAHATTYTLPDPKTSPSHSLTHTPTSSPSHIYMQSTASCAHTHYSVTRVLIVYLVWLICKVNRPCIPPSRWTATSAPHWNVSECVWLNQFITVCTTTNQNV